MELNLRQLSLNIAMKRDDVKITIIYNYLFNN